MNKSLVAVVALLAGPALAAERLPIIDMHLHANDLHEWGGPASVCTNEQAVEFPGLDPRQPMTVQKASVCETPLESSQSSAELIAETAAMLERYNIYAVTDGEVDVLAQWRREMPERIIPAATFDAADAAEPEVFRKRFAAGQFELFAEIAPQYRGLTASSEEFDRYFALAEELDIPVGLHLGEGPPGGAHVMGYSGYTVGAGRPLQLEAILLKYPKLRLYVMHYGSPLVEEMIALLYSHPQVYVDIAQNNWGFPRTHFYRQLKMLVDAGFSKRILFGSDQMIWPETIRIAIETVEAADFLTAQQKRDIFYNNAARFLRLSDEQIAQHHGRR